jgi:hypothetical protein
MVDIKIQDGELQLKNRHANGRFVKGNTVGDSTAFQKGNQTAVGHGRPKGSTGTKKQRLVERWTNITKGKHLDRVYYALLNACLQGDIAAIKLFLQYALGNPKEETILTVKQEERNPEELKNEFDKLFRN